MLACADRPVGDDGDVETETVGNGDGDPSGDGDGDPSGDGDGDPSGDGDGDPSGDGDGDGDPSGDGDGDPSGDGDGDPLCEDQWFACPDETCAWEYTDEPCCGHGGDCAPGCEPQDAVETDPETCTEAGEFAWTGKVCERVCDCDGADCDALYSTVLDCLEAHDQSCGNFDFSDCPFDATFGPTSVSGTTPFGPITYTAGAFGRSYGRGGGAGGLVLRLGVSEVELGNYIANLWTANQFYDALLLVDSGLVEPGVHEAWIYVPGEWDVMGLGTVTITAAQTEGDIHAEHTLEAMIEVSSPGWNLSGPIAIHGCDRLDTYAP